MLLRGTLCKAICRCGKARLTVAIVTSYLQLRFQAQLATGRNIQAVLCALCTTGIKHAEIIGVAAMACPTTSRATVDMHIHCIWAYVKKAGACAIATLCCRMHDVGIVARSPVIMLRCYDVRTRLFHCRALDTSTLRFMSIIRWVAIGRTCSNASCRCNSSCKK